LDGVGVRIHGTRESCRSAGNLYIAFCKCNL
jgi:hypothetical protein